MDLQFGKKITSESYHDGKPTNKQFAYSIPILVKDKSQVLGEIIKAIDLITTQQTFKVVLTIKADKNHQITTLTKEYITENITLT